MLERTAFKMRTKESCEVSRGAQGDSGGYRDTRCGGVIGSTGRKISRKGKERTAYAKDPEKRMQLPWGGANVRQKNPC